MYVASAVLTIQTDMKQRLMRVFPHFINAVWCRDEQFGLGAGDAVQSTTFQALNIHTTQAAMALAMFVIERSQGH